MRSVSRIARSVSQTAKAAVRSVNVTPVSSTVRSIANHTSNVWNAGRSSRMTRAVGVIAGVATAGMMVKSVLAEADEKKTKKTKKAKSSTPSTNDDTTQQQQSAATTAEKKDTQAADTESAKSQPRPKDDKHPTLASVTQVVADSVDELVLDTKKDVILEVYAPWCETCSYLHAVYAQVAKALADVPTVRVAVMDGEANFKPGFLSEKEAGAFPLIKLYPAGNKGNSVEWPEDQTSGHYTASSLIKFIHKYSDTKFDLEKALNASKEFDVETDQKLREVAKREVENATKGDVTLYLMSKAPCGELYQELFELVVFSKYSELRRENAVDEQINAARKCTVAKSEEAVQFWQKISDLSNKMVEQEKENQAAAATPQQQQQQQQQQAPAAATPTAATPAPTDVPTTTPAGTKETPAATSKAGAPAAAATAKPSADDEADEVDDDEEDDEEDDEDDQDEDDEDDDEEEEEDDEEDEE